MSDPTSTALPEALIRRVTGLLSPEDLESWWRHVQDPVVAARWTGASDKIDEAQRAMKAAGLEARPLPWMHGAWTLGCCDRAEITSIPEFASQRLFLQSASSMAAVMAMAIEPGHDVLDVCAAPGAKTSLIRVQQEGRGVLLANELSRRRSDRMRSLLSKFSMEDVEIRVGAGEALGGTHARCFDRVLADVPCSGEGRIRAADPSTWARWSPSSIRGLARRQEGLLEAALKCVRPGGELLYATCTMAPEENERVIDRVLASRRTPAELLPINLPLSARRPPIDSWDGWQASADLSHCVRLVADAQHTPFFMARLLRV